ncbi:MAG: carbohydrate kinase [Cyclobacteriaceae bacterium]|nr:carbohydrate kinase [Cyclobacteriaceae bacterium]
MNKDISNLPVLCFGETLWDIFENEKKPGGAPMNVAVHLSQFGIDSRLISRVGDDVLGDQLLHFLKSKKVNAQLLQRDHQHATGVVNVTLASNGDARYDIVFPSAWDFIEKPAHADQMMDEPFILVFGSLASRHEISRNTLFHLLDKASLTLFDVNFRAPHYTRELVERLLHRSNIAKVNEHEMAIIGQWIGANHDESFENLAKQVAETYDLLQVIVTLGAKGALVNAGEKVVTHPGFKVKVADTVGSGDSFLAAYLSNLMSGESVEKCLELASATGAYVATQHGAVPEYSQSDVLSVMNNK